MKLVAAFGLVIFTVAPALAQKVFEPGQPPTLPQGIVVGFTQPVEQDIPGSLSSVEGVVRNGVRIHFAQRYVDAPIASAKLGQLDSGDFAVVGERDKQLDACQEALVAAVDRIAAEAKRLGANGVTGVASYIDGGYLPAHPAFLCVQSSLMRHGDVATSQDEKLIYGVVARVRLIGTAVRLPS